MHRTDPEPHRGHSWFFDVISIIGIVVFGLFLLGGYRTAPGIDTGYFDWLVHAYRVKLLSEYGPISWTHTWSNGANIFQAYQFVPHVLTWLVATITKESITRSMMILTIMNFIGMRVILYISLRLMKTSVLPSVILATISYSITQYWGGMNDYAIIFGFTVFPLILLLFTYQLKHELPYVFPLVTGLAIYIHPMAFFYSAMLYIAGLFISPRKIVSLKTVIDITVMILAASVFFLPIIFPEALRNTAVELSSKAFLQHALADYGNLGLSFSIICIIVLTSIAFILPIAAIPQSAYITLYTIVMLFFVWTQTHLSINLPINQFQFTRGMTYIGIAALMAASGWMEALYRTRRTEIRALLVILASVGIGEAIWAASVYANPPKRTVEDPIRASIVSTQNSGLAQKRVYTPTVDATSFAAPSTVRLPSSYMGHLSPNMITARLTSLISQQGLSGKLPESTVKRILNYLTVTSTSYLVLDRYSPLTESLQKSDSPKFADYGELKLPGSTFELFGVPGIIADAYLIPDASASAISVFRRSAQSNTIRNQITLDDETAALATFLQSPHVIPLTVRYPTQESLEIVLPKDLPQTHRTIFLSESYSNAFRATHAKQSEIRVLPAGPYFIKLQLPRDITPASTITLVHRWPTHMYIAAIGIILLILGIGISTLIRIVPFRPKQLLT